MLDINNKIFNIFNSLFNIQGLDEIIKIVIKYGIKIVVAIFLWYFGILAFKRIGFVLFKTLEKSKVENTVFRFLNSLMGVITKVLLFLIILSYFGVPTTSIIAVFGSIGFAIGLSIQGIIANFVSGFIVLNSNFFKSGDYIKCCDSEGVVKDVEIFFTTLITADGKVIKIPNNKFINNSVINFSANKERRVAVSFQIPYSADIILVKSKIKELIQSNKNIIKISSISIDVKEYAPYYIVLEARCYTQFIYFWDVKYFILNNIKNTLTKIGVELPISQIKINNDV